MPCELISGIESFSDFLVYPVTCDYYFYLKILLAVGAIMAWTLFKAEEKNTGVKGDMIRPLGVTSIAISVLAVIGSLVQNTAGIAMIQGTVLLIILAICIPLFLLWVFKS